MTVLPIQFEELRQGIFGDLYVKFTDPNGVCEPNAVYIYREEETDRRILFINLREMPGRKQRLFKDRIPKELLFAWKFAKIMKEVEKRLNNMREDVPEKELP